MAIQIDVKFKDPNALGMALWPFILISKDLPYRKYNTTYNHEAIHCAQQKEMLLIFFYIAYGVEWLVRRCQYKSWDEAYRNISFEREAYANERNLSYYKTRPFWGWINYL